MMEKKLIHSVRLAAEEVYLKELYKVKRLASSNDSDRPSFHHETQNSFQTAVKSYEATINDTIENRARHKDTIKLEIDVLVRQKEMEEQNRKTYKTKLAEANLNYTTFRNRDIVKLQKTYTHKCEDLKMAQNNWQQLQQQEENNELLRSNRNSMEVNPSRLSGESTNREIDSNTVTDQHKKGMAGLISQMRTRAAANITPADQNKQITKFAKMKKDISEADGEYRDGILVLENLRKKQTKATEEVNRQLKNTIKRKTDTVKTSLTNILRSEMESIQVDMNIARTSFEAASNIDSLKDIQMFNMHYQSQGYVQPTPVRYENFYMEGKCKEVLFGGSLESYALEHNATVPKLVIKCIEAIENMGGLQKEGIYRVSGRQSNIEQLKHQFELDEDLVQLDPYDVFTIATVLKMYIRELKRPLFDFSVQTRVSYSKNMPQNQRFNMLENKLANMSLAHRSTLHYLVCHLSKINANSQMNKMNIPNLALIFTPVIFHDFNQTEEGTTHSDWSPEDLFEDLILHHEVLFHIAEESARRNNEQKLQEALNGKNPYSQFSQSNLLYLSNSTVPYPQQQQQPTSGLLLTQPMNPPNLPKTSNSSGTPLDYQPYQQQQQQYPPKLTTIIGTAPPQQQQQYMSSVLPSAPPAATSTPQSNGHVSQQYQSSESRLPSTGPSPSYQQQQPIASLPKDKPLTVITRRGSSMSHHYLNNTAPSSAIEPSSTEYSPMPTKRISLSDLPRRDSSAQQIKLPRQDSLRKNSSSSLSSQTSAASTKTTTDTQQQHTYYQANFSQDTMLAAVEETTNLDELVEYNSPTMAKPPSST
ncbi:uncharacterized protein B0P05DRAFT_107681 [Gilbertella persicaria]|uniref:uncharacterized protein n=1 Tax=Gilbertella persicaria TaxID=101096 RepID=UPI0022211FF4|nr:uncharacterized protein B0P05DRAFT_107681 [Gilbertella persicaria]KAI8079053.1 hypothetical protein B0P05DRAFT_107681 [Gilbertella persicaria]